MTVSQSIQVNTSLLQRFINIRQQTIEICAPLATEDYVVQPALDASPPKWHLGHVTWFFENFILAENIPDYVHFNQQLNYVFNSYYESQGPRILRSTRGNLSRPTTETVLAYRKHVDEQLITWLQKNEEQLSDAQRMVFEVGLQHEQQHQELLVTDLKYILGHNPLFPVYKEKALNGSASPMLKPQQWLPISEGVYEIGYEGPQFCWDNELNRHKVYLHDFEISSQLVTNGEYIEFIESGGYDDYRHWLSEGYEWAKSLAFKAPKYWHKKDGQWYHYTLNGLQPIELSAPVTHICFYEASAYANWKGCRLPTEFEWEAACAKWSTSPLKNGNFLEKQHFHPIASTAEDPHQFLGNVWEWTNSAYLPYPNYPQFKGALGEYNGKFMINQMVLRGGSCATPISHIRPTYRNFFHADKRWQFTGIRLAK